MFYKAGGKMAMGTDAGTPFNLHGENTNELQYMVDLGVSNLDVFVDSDAKRHMVGITDYVMNRHM